MNNYTPKQHAVAADMLSLQHSILEGAVRSSFKYDLEQEEQVRDEIARDHALDQMV